MHTTTLTTDSRLDALTHWLSLCLQTTGFNITPLAGDASFRRYFRVQHNAQAWIAMDAPPHLEDSHSFVAIQQHLEQLTLKVPHLYHVDLAEGFILMSDLGDTWLWHESRNHKTAVLYQAAIDDLLVMQQHASPQPLANFDHDFMGRELAFFTQWFLQDYLQLSLNSHECTLLDNVFAALITSAQTQPYYFTHRDYHSRNLMVLANDTIGILDFQDAVSGPITYDLVSLLRDCYVSLDESQLNTHLRYYFDKARALKLLDTSDFNQFKKWFDWMGMQRHLKAIFIFARKLLRDNNPHFLTHIPLTLNYVRTISAHYSELADFNHFIENRIVPVFTTVYIS